MPAPNYTLRRSGRRMVTVRIAFPIDEAEVKWVAKQLNCSEAVALSKMKKRIWLDASSGMDWKTWAVYKADKVYAAELTTISIDEAQNIIEEKASLIENAYQAVYVAEE